MGFDNFRDNRLLKDYLRIKEEQEEISNNIRKKRNQQQNKERWAKYQHYLTTILTDKMFDFAVGSGALLLDIVPNAAAAYSLRKLRTAYTGSAIEVRRSSNDDTQDIGFDANGDLDTTTLLAFVNAEITDNINTTTDSNSDGLADGLIKTNNPTATIVTGNGHIGSAQRMESNVGGGAVESISINTLGTLIGQEITISFLYRSNISFELGNANTSAGGGFNSIPANTGDAIRYEHKGVWSPTAGDDGRMEPMWIRNAGEFIEISDWSVTYHTADGAVRTWYDQSGNINNALNGTDTQQPLIVNTGSLVTEEGKPAIQFDGANDYLQKAFTLSNPVSHFVVAQATNQGDFIIDGYNVVNVNSLYTTSTTLIRLANGATMTEDYTIGTQAAFSSISKGTDSLLAVNGSSTTQALSTNSMDGVTIGAPGTLVSTYNLLGTIQEIIIFASDQSDNRTFIENHINSFYKIYP